jgi:adenosylcobinamide-GDP ribazoletransferase
MTTQAIGWMRAQHSFTPDRPFFVYFAPGATHAPHHVPKEWIEKYKGQFDGGWDKLRILEIMKDSRVGSYGVVAMVLALLGKFTLVASLDGDLVPYALLAGHALSRFCSTVLLATMDYVREDLLSKAKPLATRLSGGEIVVALAFALGALALLPLEKAFAGCVLAALVTLWLAAKFKRWLGGYTGDCLGAVQQVSEIAFYLGLLAVWLR